MIDFVETTAAESARFLAALTALETELAGDGGGRPLASVPVPSCPDWTAADLAWHVAEVQYFWATIVEGNLATPSAVASLSRPDDTKLVDLVARQSERLVTQLDVHHPGEPCWSWYERGRSVGWVRRRQAHEALIHRVDAELALESVRPGARTPVDEDLAADGIDELLRVMLDAAEPAPWASFEPDGTTARLEVPDRSWLVRFGRLHGTDPEGTVHDLDAVAVADPAAAGGAEPTVTVAGPAAELDLWLWRRCPLQSATITGDPAVADRLHELAALE